MLEFSTDLKRPVLPPQNHNQNQYKTRGHHYSLKLLRKRLNTDFTTFNHQINAHDPFG